MGEFDKSAAAHPGRDPLKELVHQFFYVLFYFIVGESGQDKPHAAIYVKPDSAR
jgi:hypothetical protein